MDELQELNDLLPLILAFLKTHPHHTARQIALGIRKPLTKVLAVLAHLANTKQVETAIVYELNAKKARARKGGA
jgi:hypothetical protein